MPSVARLIAPAALALLLLAVPSAVTSAAARPSTGTTSRPPHPKEDTGHWVDTWTAMPQLTEPANLPPGPFTQPGGVLQDSTLRQTVHLSTGGQRLRLHFSNEFGGAPLPLTRISVAWPEGGGVGVRAIEPGSSRPVTFDGAASVTVPVGAQYASDPLDLPVVAGTDLTVTVYLADGQASPSVTSHPGSRTTSYLTSGNHTDDADLPGATTAEHWYFLSAVEAWSPEGTTATAVIGDSLTDGRGSTTNGNDRWPDQLFDRLQSQPGTRDIAVLNQGAGGNRVLNDGLGPSAVSRLNRDVFAHSGVSRLLIFEGVNDIGTADATEAAQQAVSADLITAFGQMATQAHAQGIGVYGATILPFGNNEMYDDPGGLREAARQRVNEWIRDSGRFDAVLDFDGAVRDPDHPDRLLDSVQVGDWLHLTPEGYGLLAAAVPFGLFTP